MKASNTKKLLIAIGNNAREDDGLGWAFAEQLEQTGSFEGEVVHRYQLQVEDAELIQHYDEVIFVDASKASHPNGFEVIPCEPQLDSSFTSHAVSPSSILYLCQDLYGRQPAAHLVLIEGKQWDLKMGLSAAGGANLQRALNGFLKSSEKATP